MSLIPSPANDLIGDLAAPYALISSSQRYIGTIIPDVTVREIHTDEDTITIFPVETGTPISDHVFANPKLIEIQCAFSDSTAGFTGYVQQVYEAFLALKATREPFDVSTGKRLYQNMLFGNITVVTDEQSEYALMVTARLQEVIITNTDDASGSGMTQANQAFPESTAPTTDFGAQSSGSGLTNFGVGGPVASTGTGIGTSGVSAFGNYMGNFSGGTPVGTGGIGHA